MIKLATTLVFLALFVWFSDAKPAKDGLFQVDDMLLTKHQVQAYDQIKSGRSRRAALKDRYLWPKGTIYYTFKSNLGEAGENLAKDAMKHWEDKTCIKFVKRTNQKNYVEFQFAGGCLAQVGYARRPKQLISIGSRARLCPLGSAIHEIGHAVAFFHEQNRPDRDSYITVKMENMIKNKVLRDQYKKVNSKYIDYRKKKYDYGSIMHYSRLQGSKNGKPVMVPKKANVPLGQRDGLSVGDIAQIKVMYKCNAKDESEFDYNPELGEDTETDTDKTDEKTDGPKPGEVES